MTKAFLAAALTLMLAACMPTPAPVTPGLDPVTGQPVDLAPFPNDPDPDLCNSASHGSLIGQPAASVATAGITTPVRVIPLGGMVTADYNGARINFSLDAAGNIAKITCG